jgi:formyltetrahydrofolate-dependent phosphoribosylglycinamide formyltransferase
MTNAISSLLRPDVITVMGFATTLPLPELVMQCLAADDCKDVAIEFYSVEEDENAFQPDMSIIERALLAAPYRRFLSGSGVGSQRTPMVLYRLPLEKRSDAVVYSPKVAMELAQIRALLLSSSSAKEEVTIRLYDPSVSAFVNGTEPSTLLAALATCEQQLLSHHLSSAPTAGDTVVVVGSGGREHALAVQLARSPAIASVLCVPGNGGTAQEGGKIRNVVVADDHGSMVALCQQFHVAMVVVGPEQPLVDGLVDVLLEECPGTLAFGPTQAAAQLEASKAWTKDFLQQYDLPTASYRNFTNVEDAVAYVHALDIDGTGRRQVIKASGLAAGKGVLLPETAAETVLAIHEIMSDRAFGAAGDTCVVEDYLTGPEASCLAFCDGSTAKCLPAAQDHKRALDGDHGMNTGGMGAYGPAPCVTPDLFREIEGLCQKTVEKMKERGTPYVGILYAGVMLTPHGPQILEFNCRFGDPETQILLPLLQTDLYTIFKACCTGTLDQMEIAFHSSHAATVVCAAQGYPQSYPKGMRITGLERAAEVPNVKVYHAGTVLDEESGVVRCNGGRVLAVTGTGPDLSAALQAAYAGVGCIDFVRDDDPATSLLHHRTDIGRKAVEKKLRIGVLGSTRGTALLPVIEACANGVLPAEIAAVLSNKETAPILEKGKALGSTVLTKALPSKGLSREEFDAECTAALLGAGVDFVLLVGYMRILSKSFTDFWSGRCINVHPSLLPLHAGGMDLAVHQGVIDAGEGETGCTIHYVTEAVDGGPIVVQKHVTVEASDTAESLKAKVQPLEGPAFVEAIELYCEKSKFGAICYADAGVSINAGNHLVDLIKPFCKATRRPGCDADLGGFGGLFDLAAAGYNAAETVLIGATDGVGTKLRIAQMTGKHETIGIDLVAMCVNDLVVAGGEPLFFLDYFATGKLNVEEAALVVKGIADGCKEAGCGLIGGETAEMPSMYAPGDYDLAGFTVGAVHRDRILPQNIIAGDVLLGIASSGVHSNGFSLVRKLVEKSKLSYESPCPWDTNYATVGDALLVPTKIYVKSCLPLIRQRFVKGMAHITGGGLLENLPRSLPEGHAAEISYHPPLPPVFQWLKETSGLDDTEMLRTFNCGIGMVVILSSSDVPAAKELLMSLGESEVYDLGTVIKGDRQVLMKVHLS